MHFFKGRNYSPKLQSLLIIWALTAVSCLFIFRHFLFGEALAVFSDAGSDTKQQYLMQYSTIVNHIKDGNFSLWDLNNGFGTSMFALNMTNIFLMLVYAAGVIFGVGYMPGVIVYLLILEIFLAATFCYFFLDRFSFSERSKVTAAYLYGLNGYMLVWGQHYQFGAFMVFLPLLLLTLECAVQQKKFSLSAPFVVAAMVLSSVYMSYMSLLMAGCYLIFRMVVLNGPRKERIRQFFTHCLSILLGLGIGSCIFVPMAYYLLNISSRLDSEVSFFGKLLKYLVPYEGRFFETAFLRLFSTTFQGIRDYNGYSNFYEAPVLFFSALFVILVLQYIFTIHRQDSSRRAKIMQYLAVVFFFCCLGVKLGACIFNAFAYPFSRHSFIFMPGFAVVTAFTLDQIRIKRRLSITGLVTAVAAIGAAHWLAYQQVTEDLLRTCVILFFLCALSMTVLVIGIRWKSTGRLSRVISLLLLLACAADVSLEGYLCYNDRTVLTTSDPEYWGGLYNPNVTEALNYLKETDDSLYRVEKDYYSGSFCMDGLAQNYRGISTYNSTPNRYLEEFIELVIPNFPIMAAHEYSYRQIGYYAEHGSLFGIKYLLSRSADLELAGYTLLKQFGDVYVYQNENVSSMARFYAQAGDSAALDGAYGRTDLERMLLETILLESEETENLDALVSGITGKELLPADALSEQYALEEVPVEIANIRADGSTDSVTIPIDRSSTEGYERLYLEFDMITPQVTDITVNEDDPMEYHFRLSSKTKKHVQLAIPDSYESVVLSRYGGELKGKITNIRLLGSKVKTESYDRADITLTDAGNDSRITGTVTTQDGGFLFLPVPYEEGWTASVDGAEVTILRSDAGFMSIPVAAGDHTFTFTYRQPYLKHGAVISVVSLGIWCVICGVRVRRRKKIRNENA